MLGRWDDVRTQPVGRVSASSPEPTSRSPVRIALSEPSDALRGVILRCPTGSPHAAVRPCMFCS